MTRRSHGRMGPALLRRINEQKLLEHLQIYGPSSRARLKRVSGLTAPTVSKVVDALVERGLLEEIEPTEIAVGLDEALISDYASAGTTWSLSPSVEVFCAIPFF